VLFECAANYDYVVQIHQAEIKSGQAEMREEIRAIRADVEKTIRQRMENVMTCINLEKQNLHKELTEKIEKAHVELQAVEVSLDTRAKKLQENLKVISTDLTMVDIEVKTTRKEALEQQRLMKEKIEADMREFRARLEEVGGTAQRGGTPAVGASTVQPPTFNGVGNKGV
jgi:hypothetical protein